MISGRKWYSLLRTYTYYVAAVFTSREKEIGRLSDNSLNQTWVFIFVDGFSCRWVNLIDDAVEGYRADTARIFWSFFLRSLDRWYGQKTSMGCILIGYGRIAGLA
jgi:hypothetical protein